MKGFFEKIKDFLYDGVDYVMMIAVIALVALIINWRLNGLFAKDAADLPPNTHTPTVNEQEPNNTYDFDKKIDKPKEDEDKNEDLNSLVKVNIPSGSLPSKIGDILLSHGLIHNKDEFMKKMVELKLDTKLKSGDFEIPQNSTLEEIIKIITR